MKRFHVHAHVTDLKASIAFYAKLFAAEPSRVETDYAKWMLEDPRINFAISTRGNAVGDANELAELKARARNADMALLDQGATSCCDARSDKYWVTDPQGIAWEQFHTLDTIPVFGAGTRESEPQSSACCAPAACVQPSGVAAKPAASCC